MQSIVLKTLHYQSTFAALAERKSEISEIRQNGSLNSVFILETYALKNWKPYALSSIFEISMYPLTGFLLFLELQAESPLFTFYSCYMYALKYISAKCIICRTFSRTILRNIWGRLPLQTLKIPAASWGSDLWICILFSEYFRLSELNCLRLQLWWKTASVFPNTFISSLFSKTFRLCSINFSLPGCTANHNINHLRTWIYHICKIILNIV